MVSHQPTSYDAAVVGAGITGLTAASLLHNSGHSVIVLEKDTIVGGRLATRRMGPGYADHGAQFITVRDDLFASVVGTWQQSGLAYIWSHGWSKGSLDTAKSDGHPRFAVTGGMLQLANHLATPLEQAGIIFTNTQVFRLTMEHTGWLVQVAGGPSIMAHRAILTCPAPQALELLASGDVPLADDDFAVLAAIQYAPCLCGLFWIDGDVRLPESGALQMPGAAVSWIADNKRKGISPAARILTVHAAPKWSELHFDCDDDTILDRLRVEISPILTTASFIIDARLEMGTTPGSTS